MFKATQAIKDEFDRVGIKYRVVEDEKRCIVEAGFKSDAGTSVRVQFISRDDDNDVAVRAFSLASVPESKVPAVTKLANDSNLKYRYIKFVVDNDNDFNAEYDFPVRCENIGPACGEIFVRFMKIIDEVLPAVMKEIWRD